jgi:hypothetical protein
MTKSARKASSMPTREWTTWRKSVARSPEAAIAPTVVPGPGVMPRSSRHAKR